MSTKLWDWKELAALGEGQVSRGMCFKTGICVSQAVKDDPKLPKSKNMVT